MDIHIDHDSAVAPFEQLRLQILALTRDGKLLAGTRLPTVRALAAELHLAPNTVARAYRELEDAGAIETRGRLGSFVAEAGDVTHRQAGAAAVDFVATTRRLGISDDEALELVRTALRGAESSD